MLWLLDTCADEAHHVHSSGEENGNRCFKGRQLQIIAVCAPSLIQAVMSDLPHFWVNLNFPRPLGYLGLGRTA